MDHSKDTGNFSDGAWAVLDHLARMAADRVIKLRFRPQYQEALEVLCETMQNHDREREVVWKQISKLKRSGSPTPEHIPTLIELERITREAGGTAYVDVDRTVFEELARIDRPAMIPIDFLLESFRYRRRYDNFARRRRVHAVKLAVTIAARTGDIKALDALIEMLSDPKSNIRGEAIVALYNAYKWECGDYDEQNRMPAMLLDHIWDAARNDRSRQVRKTALTVLYHMGEVSYEEAVEYLEKK
ncbi:MAG: HEAT repeat domain-containing protein [Chloroflexi bacterium]|nr:HEAT repeat domain-containing protein [Chloroflexota bacterium]